MRNALKACHSERSVRFSGRTCCMSVLSGASCKQLDPLALTASRGDLQPELKPCTVRNLADKM
eukprot:773465-Pelagomonas_calceolata.AAC.1